MHGALRKLAVTVTEEDPNAFRWEVIELLPDGRWNMVEDGGRRLRTYHSAMAEGLLALQRMVPDLDLGPRESIQREEEGDRPARSVFGFGFGLPRYGHSDDS